MIGSPERPVLMGYVDDEATQKRFYEALLKLPWLAPDVRNAIMRELGRSPREEEVRTEKARTWTLRHEVSEVEAAGGVSGQIIEDDADARGLGEVHVGEVARAGGEVVFVNLILDRSFP